MAPEIPAQLQYQHMLSNTFPGFFSALTLFMLIDILSPKDLTSWVNKDITSLLSFIGFVVLAGTIIGVIIDGIHHSIIEGTFNRFLGLKEINESLKALYPSVDFKMKHSYFFKVIGDNAIDIFEYLVNVLYRYSEFHANTFISLVPFSFITPFYLYYVLEIPRIWSLSLALISFSIACACLICSYEDLKDYQVAKLSFIVGYLECEYYINLRAEPIDFNNFELMATIFDKDSQISVLEKGIKVNFKTTLGDIALKNNGETDAYAIARAILSSNKSGTAIVTATFKKCIPGVTSARFR